MKYIKLYETWRGRYWSINFQDPYVIYKASKILKNSSNFKKKIDSIINYRDNHPYEMRDLYITNCDSGFKWNAFDEEELKSEGGFTYSGKVELTDEEKELADMEISAKKYNL